MRLIADVHGAAAKLRAMAAEPGPLLILGDLINFIDYRTNQGIVTDVSGKTFTDQMVALRTAGEAVAAGALWHEFRKGREVELRQAYDQAITAGYDEIMDALAGAESYVTYGNVDRPDLIKKTLPAGSRFVDAEVLEIEGIRVGFAGGGITSIGTAGEISEETMVAKLEEIGPVDMLCTHVPPALRPLARDVIAGRDKGSSAVLGYIHRHQPKWHYFGDVHQPQAATWRIGETLSRNVGYFRATGRAWTHV
ncbi:MAG: metallophosphoesterase [bacterium]|nr:metallophosphoesterase [bacterium]